MLTQAPIKDIIRKQREFFATGKTKDVEWCQYSPFPFYLLPFAFSRQSPFTTATRSQSTALRSGDQRV